MLYEAFISKSVEAVVVVSFHSYNPCHVLSLLAVGSWLTGCCLHPRHIGKGVKYCPRQTGWRKYPLKTLCIKYLQIPFLIIAPPRTEKCRPDDSNFPLPPFFQLLFLHFLGNGPYLSPAAPFPCPCFLQSSPQNLLHHIFRSASPFPPPTLPAFVHLFWRKLWA